MAVGDIIIGITSATATYTNYQPSSGVELIVTSLTGYGNIQYGNYDGTNFFGIYIPLTSEPAYGQIANTKVGITNTYYFRFYTTNSRGYFSAIQTK